MRTVFDEQEPGVAPTRPAAGPPAPMAGDNEAVLAAVDHTFHFAALFARAGAYALLALAAARFDCGPHLLAGMLFGDFAGFALAAIRALHKAPVAALAEFALFALVFAIWWWRYDWPASTEFRALFGLAAFGVLVARLGLQSRELRGHGAPGWD